MGAVWFNLNMDSNTPTKTGPTTYTYKGVSIWRETNWLGEPMRKFTLLAFRSPNGLNSYRTFKTLTACAAFIDSNK